MSIIGFVQSTQKWWICNDFGECIDWSGIDIDISNGRWYSSIRVLITNMENNTNIRKGESLGILLYVIYT